MQGFWQRISQPFQQLPNEERLIILAVVLACLVAIAVYVTKRIRGGIYDTTPSITEHLSEFRRMREAGQLDPTEYSRVVQSISSIDQPEDGEHAVASEGAVEEPPAR
jgi:hypothetical protein